MKAKKLNRRQFMQTTVVGVGLGALLPIVSFCGAPQKIRKPNLIFIFADQWRACDTGFAGNTEVKTPHLDALARQSTHFSHAVSGCPVCSPYRASLLTGQYWLSHGIFYNDKPLDPEILSIAKVYSRSGYDTAYIGKWHLNGHPKGMSYQTSRTEPISSDRRLGFDFWRAYECTHEYNNSFYYDEENIKHRWEGYDAIAQTQMAQQYLRDHAKGKPFTLFLSWGPPHDPYLTAPDTYRQMFEEHQIVLRPNVPAEMETKVRTNLSGYYAHIAALDDCIFTIVETLRQTGLERDTILVFTSDHGDMMGSHGHMHKQKPWDESIRIPFLLRYPAVLGTVAQSLDVPINTPDIMATLLGLSGIPIPDSVQGKDFSPVIRGEEIAPDEIALLMCPVPFHQWNYKRGGREYRGIRTTRYTFVRDLQGPWLLYDNEIDPYQLDNLAIWIYSNISMACCRRNWRKPTMSFFPARNI